MSKQLPDSGERSEFMTGAVRDSSKGKGFPSDIPPIAIRAIARRFEDGAAKYDRGNFRKGIPVSRFIDSIMRHLMALQEGDTSEEHDSAIAWNAVVLIWTLDAIKRGALPQDLDDRAYILPTQTGEVEDEREDVKF